MPPTPRHRPNARKLQHPSQRPTRCCTASPERPPEPLPLLQTRTPNHRASVPISRPHRLRQSPLRAVTGPRTAPPCPACCPPRRPPGFCFVTRRSASLSLIRDATARVSASFRYRSDQRPDACSAPPATCCCRLFARRRSTCRRSLPELPLWTDDLLPLGDPRASRAWEKKKKKTKKKEKDKRGTLGSFLSYLYFFI